LTRQHQVHGRVQVVFASARAAPAVVGALLGPMISASDVWAVPADSPCAAQLGAGLEHALDDHGEDAFDAESPEGTEDGGDMGTNLIGRRSLSATDQPTSSEVQPLVSGNSA